MISAIVRKKTFGRTTMQTGSDHRNDRSNQATPEFAQRPATHPDHERASDDHGDDESLGNKLVSDSDNKFASFTSMMVDERPMLGDGWRD